MSDRIGNSATGCFHCGEPVPRGTDIVARLGESKEPVCCIGCRSVAELIHASGLGAYYAFRSRPHPDSGLRPEPSEWAHYDGEDLLSRYVHRRPEFSEATVEIGGLYCSACTWLLEKALQGQPAVESLTVSPATRRAVIRWNASALPFSALLAAIAAIGFRPQPLAAGQSADPAHDEYRFALKRLIVAAAAGMQVMMFAVALYAGDFFGIDGPMEKFLRTVSLLVTLPVVLYSARPFYKGAWRGLRARAPGMDLPVSIAIIAAFLASVRATLLDQGEIYFDSVAMFVLFLSATRYLEMRARHRSDDYAFALARLLPDAATRISGGRHEIVSIDSLRVDDVVRVRTGDVLPVDGEVLSGTLLLDESMLTGEAMPVTRVTGAAVMAGSVNRGGSSLVRVTRTGAATSLAEVARLLERAKADRPRVAQLADRIASVFVIAMLAIAALTGGWWLAIDAPRAFEIVLATLVVTCPCALALATPAALAAAASTLASRGFLLVRSRLLAVLGSKATIVFDKTGTLTEGRPKVLQVQSYRDGWSSERCMALAASIETASEHVLARAFPERGPATEYSIGDAAVAAGEGVQAMVDGARWRIGSARYVTPLLDGSVAPASIGDDARTTVFLGDERGVVAQFAIGDALRTDALATVTALRESGFHVVIASGDRPASVGAVARTLGVDDWHAAMLPQDKVALVRNMRREGQAVVMIGDGINDAPVLAAADASIALDAGTALARATADGIVVGKRLSSVLDGVTVARATRRIVRQNIGWAIAYNMTAVPLAASGMLAPWMAALGMSASSLIVVLNALRLHRHARRAPAGADDAPVFTVPHELPV
jgi:Cu2+-exporting ATPase